MSRGNRRSPRGASWHVSPANARAAYRLRVSVGFRLHSVGFRALQEVEGSSGPRTPRGGSWNDDPAYARAAYRDRVGADYRNRTVGFRVVQKGAFTGSCTWPGGLADAGVKP
jgi:formylglycine-generating enzyme required for sulfatase activity